MHKFWYDVKPKYDGKAKFCYMDADMVSLYT